MYNRVDEPHLCQLCHQEQSWRLLRRISLFTLFHKHVTSTSQLAHLGELPWESKVKHSLHFAWKETQMMLALLVASCSLSATLGAYKPPSCSVNRPSCPGCITKPQVYTIKAGTFGRGQIPAHGASCQMKKTQEEATPSKSDKYGH